MRALNLIPVAVLASLAAVGCAPAAEEDVDAADSDLTTSPFDEACSAPIRSEDGKYVALDLCPKNNNPGKVVRVDIATGTQTTITTYPAADKVDRLAQKGDKVFFAIRHTVDGNGRATGGVDVVVRDWALAADVVGRTITPAAPTGVNGSFGSVGALLLSEDGKSVAFSAGDTVLANFLFVAPISGNAAPTALNLEVSTANLRWSTSGATFVGHDPDDTMWTGEKLYVVDANGDNGQATLVGSRHVDWTSFEFGQGGTRAQEPFDGTRVVGFKVAPNEQSIGTVDPRTGEEKVLDKAPLLSIVTDLNQDVLYARVTEVPGAGGFVRELVRQPRAGGEKKILIVSPGAAQAELVYGFDPIALTKTSAYGVFGTRTGATGVAERFVVKLDASAPAVKLGDKVRVIEQLGDRVLVEDATPTAPVFQTLDLNTGAFTTIGPSGAAGAFATLAGDGSIVQLKECTTDQGFMGLSVKRTAADGTSEASTCAWMPWASIPLVAPGSGSIVYYSSSGPFPNYRYEIGIVKP